MSVHLMIRKAAVSMCAILAAYENKIVKCGTQFNVSMKIKCRIQGTILVQ